MYLIYETVSTYIHPSFPRSALLYTPAPLGLIPGSVSRSPDKIFLFAAIDFRFRSRLHRAASIFLVYSLMFTPLYVIWSSGKVIFPQLTSLHCNYLHSFPFPIFRFAQFVCQHLGDKRQIFLSATSKSRFISIIVI